MLNHNYCYMARVALGLLLLQLYQLVKCDAEMNWVNNYCSGNSQDYTQSVKTLFYNLSSEVPYRKFYSSSAGENTNKVHGLYHCREDLSSDVCDQCIQVAEENLALKCHDSTEAIAWYYECVLQYSNRSTLFQALSIKTPFAWGWSNFNASDRTKFEVLLKNAVDQLIMDAVTGTSPRNFAVKEVNSTLYALAQCNPDMDISDCKDCLQLASLKLYQCCSESQYGMVFLPSCQLRFDSDMFYNSSALQHVHHVKTKKHWQIWVTLTCTIIGVLVLCGVCFIVYKRKTRRSQKVDMEEIRIVESLQFSFNTIKAATNNFSTNNKLGKGGFGEVHKGKLGAGQEIAVKRLSRNSLQGTLEFKNETVVLAKLQHRNLVRLLGFCIAPKEKILIYEFLSNSSLDRFLDDPVKRAALDWETRFKIITGIARGLLYLHEDSRLKIIHRDLKSSNILLDESMNPKISDFGIAKLVGLDHTQGDTTRIVGTYGYMAPEYAMSGQFSVKSDVYSFGIIVLEIISGQKNSRFHQQQHDEGLLDHAWSLWNQGTELKFVDSLLGEEFCSEEVRIAMHIGLLCVQEDANKRPSMTPVVTALNGQSITLPLPTQPYSFTVVTDDATCTEYYSIEIEDRVQANKCDESICTSSESGSIELCPGL